MEERENIDTLKHSTRTSPRYKLSNANVYVSPENGYHYIDHLDDPVEFGFEQNGIKLTKEKISYIEKSLQSNPKRFEDQIQHLERQCPSIKGKKVLDIGCGGGLFLSMAENRGALVTGIELSENRTQYLKLKYDFEVINQPIEASYFQKYRDEFDFVTLWDVIEHVNYPLATLRSSAKVLKSGGFLLIDTPCRDSFYHRVGEITYRLSRGKYPTFLNAMYSSQKFGHKQIFSTSEIKDLFEESGFEVIELIKVHELTFPLRFYLKKLFRSDIAVKLFLPIADVFFSIFPIKNKMVVVGRKRA
ncbi:MAG: class I SAM-dependent methyltransferase [Balneolales bacterium]